MTTTELPASQPRPARAPRATTARRRRRSPAWLVPTGLIALGLVPMVAGSVRLASLAGGVDASSMGPAPAPTAALVAHIVGVTVYVLLGASQFHRDLRRRRPRWHRVTGRVVLPAGLVAAVSGMWLAVEAVGPHETTAFVVLRLVVGLAMASSLVLGLRAILARDVRGHRAWMARAYALGQGAGTQAVVLTVALAVLGELTPDVEAAFFAFTWLLNLAVVEWALRRR